MNTCEFAERGLRMEWEFSAEGDYRFPQVVVVNFLEYIVL